MPAITSPINKALLLRGVTAAAFPALVGKVVLESDIPFQLRSPRTVPGVLTQRVTRANGSGHLSFGYRIALTEADYDDELRLAISFSLFGLVVNFADYRVDGSGKIGPNQFDSSPQEGYSFKFSHGIAVGRDTRFCFVSTNVREYSETGGTVKLITGLKSVSMNVATPAGSAPSRWIQVADVAQNNPELESASTSAEIEKPDDSAE